MNYFSKSVEETKRLGKKIATKLKGGEVLCFYGSLGAGKTTFIQGIINSFLPKKRVLSPTFIIVRHYQVPDGRLKYIYHVDLYRLDKKTEIISLGLDEFIGRSNSLVLIEWAEKLGSLLPKKRWDINFQIEEEFSRSIKIEKHD